MSTISQEELEYEKKLVSVVPSSRQLALEQMEFYGFIHFTVNTFTDREWGDGTESESVFNPTDLDADEWAAAAADAGMKGLILTCKHHDGFCLWPSKYTSHTVANSPFRGGKGDVVRELSDACRRHGLKFGVYLSPWDRNHPTYGTGDAYNDYFINQLTELLTGYGDIFAVWFDGACGEGKNGKKQVYDWNRYYETIRRLQPGACISVCGPDVRWCGNEAGDTRPSEWSVVPLRTKDTEKVAEKSQQTDEDGFRTRKLTAADLDLGSREILRNEKTLIWYPAEVNTSIRPGWFYHESEDDKVKSLDELLHVYFNSVGGNATFLLNVPPTREGRIHANDKARLHELGAFLRDAFAKNLLDQAGLDTDAKQVAEETLENIRKDDEKSFVLADGEHELTITAKWETAQTIRYVVLKEDITKSQRVERFVIEAADETGAYQTVYEGTVIGYKKIACLEPVQTTSLRLRITESRVAPTLLFMGAY